MAEVLVLQLGRDDGQASWMTADTAGVRLGVVESGPLRAVAGQLGQRRLLVLVPGTDVLLTRASVPVRSTAKLLQLVPYALEEQLAEDIERLHFAVGKPQPNGEVPVAAVTRETLDRWLEQLAAAGLRPHGLYSETGAAPASPGNWTVLLDGERAIVTTPQGRPTTFDGIELDELVDLLEASEPAEGEADPASRGLSLIVYLAENDLPRLNAQIERLRERLPSLDIKRLPDGPLPQLAVRTAASPGINLLQGAYAPQSSATALWRPWRVAAALLLAAFTLHIVGQSLTLWNLKRREALLDEQITAVYRSAFPRAERVVNPRFQMEQQLAAVRGTGGGDDDFLLGLATVGKAVAAAPNTRIDLLSFRNDELTLRLQAPNVEALDNIRRAVNETGRFEAEIQSATPGEDRVEGRLQLRGSGG